MARDLHGVRRGAAASVEQYVPPLRSPLASSGGVTGQSFLAVPPTLLALAALVLAIRSLDTSPPFSQIDFPPSSQLEIVTFLSPLDEEDDEHWDWEKEVVRIEKAVVAGSREVLGLSKVCSL